MRTKVRLFVFYCIAHASPQPFFNYTTAIIANHHLFQWFPVQSPHTSAAIFFCDITKSSENVIADIVHCLWNGEKCGNYRLAMNIIAVEAKIVIGNLMHFINIYTEIIHSDTYEEGAVTAETDKCYV